MLRSYLRIAWRNLLKSKLYSVINIAGLSIGLACAMAIGLFVWDEYNFDRFHRNAPHIYRVVQKQNQAGEIYDVASSPGPMGQALKADFPEVTDACLLGSNRSGILQSGGTTVESSAVTTADKGFLRIFDFEVLIGNVDKLFANPGEIVITERMAVNLFGDDWKSKEDLLGTVIVLNKDQTLSLSGVMRNPPANSHIQFDAVLSFNPNSEKGNT
jgi:putative ABC transport system permease protein